MVDDMWDGLLDGWTGPAEAAPKRHPNTAPKRSPNGAQTSAKHVDRIDFLEHRRLNVCEKSSLKSSKLNRKLFGRRLGSV